MPFAGTSGLWQAKGIFKGAGSPLLLGQPQSGEMVLDLGCGAGFDGLLTAQTEGRSGKVVVWT